MMSVPYFTAYATVLLSYVKKDFIKTDLQQRKF